MNALSIIIPTVCSGLLATIITIIIQKKSEAKRIKIEIFEVLMAHRYLISDKENVEALNKVEIIFNSDDEVLKAWSDFLSAAESANPSSFNNTNDKYLKLLEKIANNIGYKKVDWESIKHYYYPQGLANKITEEELLRKAQLSQANEIAKQDTINGQPTAEQLGMQLILKALETPDGLEKIARVAKVFGNDQGKRKK